MERRKFIFLSGIAAASCATLAATEFWEDDKPPKRVDPNQFQQPVLKGIAYGLNAPNPHNTQAWKFQFLSPNELLFFVDEHRLLKATDPTTRQIHIGCGCFLECSRLGMTLDGYTTTIEFFPKGIENYQQGGIGKEPIAKITYLKEEGLKSAPLAAYISKRRTSRLNYSNIRIETSDFASIMELIQPKSSEINLITNEKRLQVLLPILAAGMSVETYTFRTHGEARKWFRENDNRIEKEKDGINLPGNGVKGIKKWIAERQLKGLPKEKWHSKRLNEYSLNAHNKRVLSSQAIVTLKTSSNTYQDWLNAGIEYLRLQLACCKFNYYLHPLSQVLQEFEEMETLRLQFEKEMDVKAAEKIQMAVRIGHSRKPYLSFRRDVKDMVTDGRPSKTD